MNRIFFLLTFLSLLLLFTDEVFTQDKETNKEVISKTLVEKINIGSSGSGGSTIKVPNQKANKINKLIRSNLTEQPTVSKSGSASSYGINYLNSNANNESNEIVLFDLRKFSDDNSDQVPDGWATNISNIQFAPEGEFCIKINSENILDNYFNYLFETIPNVSSYEVRLDTDFPLTSFVIKEFSTLNEKLSERNILENLISSQIISIPFSCNSNTNRILISISFPQGDVGIKNLSVLSTDPIDEVQNENN